MSDEFLQFFGLKIARYLDKRIPLQQAQSAVLNVIADLRESGRLPSQFGRIGDDALPETRSLGPLTGRRTELVFVHDCRNHGCNISHCVLCKHNPNKRCTGNFAHKYWVGDRLLAKCEGDIQVELIDTSGARVTEDLSEYRIEVCILDGNKYNTKCREAGEQRLEILDDCEVLHNQKAEPLLYSATANNTRDHPRVVLKFQSGTAMVPLREVKVTESSESVLAGTKRPPFRLVVRAIHESGQRLDIRPAVSEEFVVVTKRTKNLKKQEIPSLDDPIAKLNHVGKETVKKLNELKASADEVQMELNLPRELDRITKVKDFLKLTRMSEADGHLQQKLKQLLKLSKEKWEAACEHAKTAVQTDNRMRAWYMSNMTIGLLYTCMLGGVRPDCPVALLQNRQAEGSEYMEVIPMEHQLPAQREQVQSTCEQAIKCWWEETHPGWMIFTLANKHFESLDQIIQFSHGGSRLEPIREQMYQREDPSQPAYREQHNEAVADSLSSDQSEGKAVQDERNVRARTQIIRAEQSHNTSPQHSTAERATHFSNPDAFQQRQNLGPEHAGSLGGGNGMSERRRETNDSNDFNPFRSRSHMDYQPSALQPHPEEGRWPKQGNVDPGSLVAPSWPEVVSAGSFPPDMMAPLMSLNGFPDLTSLQLPSMAGKGSFLPAFNTLMFNDSETDPAKMMFFNGMQAQMQQNAGVKRKLEPGTDDQM